MPDPKAPPLPPSPSGKAEPGFADQRREFDDLSKATRTDTASELEFLASRIEMLRNDPNVSADERDRAVSELQKRIDSLTNCTPK